MVFVTVLVLQTKHLIYDYYKIGFKNYRRSRFLPPVDYSPKVGDLNPSLDGLDDYDIGDTGSEDDLDLSLSSFFPATDGVAPVATTTDTR